MSRQSPTGFVFSVMFEIVAVVAVVSLLPRIDLRPTRSVSAGEEPAVSPVEAFVPPTLEYKPASGSFSSSGSFSTAPPLIESPSRPQYVEDRLDRASQKLMNSVGGAVNQVTDDWLRPQQGSFATSPQVTSPQPMPQQTSQPQSFYAARPAYEQPPRVSSQPPAAPPPGQHQRRWLKY
jgi:hypothetical protein